GDGGEGRERGGLGLEGRDAAEGHPGPHEKDQDSPRHPPTEPHHAIFLHTPGVWTATAPSGEGSAVRHTFSRPDRGRDRGGERRRGGEAERPTSGAPTSPCPSTRPSSRGAPEDPARCAAGRSGRTRDRPLLLVYNPGRRRWCRSCRRP